MANKANFARSGLVWTDETKIDLNLKRYKNIQLPSEDLCNSRYDLNKGRLSKVLLIFSTPRCGSTALCDYFVKSDLCIPHEYFQPYQYMPYLAKRWNASEDGILSPIKYLKSLIKHRVNENGILGVNLHGSHLGVFSYFLNMFPEDVEVRAINLKRKDKIAQATSYYLASVTKSWSSYFDQENDLPDYSFQSINEKLSAILAQEVLVDRFVNENNYFCQNLYYEDLCEKPIFIPPSFGKILNLHYIDINQSSTRKQSKPINYIFSERFKEDLDTISMSKYI